MTFLLRTRVDPATSAPIAERTLWSTGRLMNVYLTMPLEQRVEEGLWQSRFTMILLTVFAVLALVLATAGLYAVISYLAAQRTQEIGIRLALGARPRDVLWMVTVQGVGLAGAGVAIGLAARWHRPSDRHAPLRRGGNGSADAGRGGRHPAGRGRGRMRGAGAAGRPHRSGPGAARRLTDLFPSAIVYEYQDMKPILWHFPPFWHPRRHSARPPRSRNSKWRRSSRRAQRSPDGSAFACRSTARRSIADTCL